MKVQRRIAAATTVAVLGFVPAVALASGSGGSHGKSVNHANPSPYTEGHSGTSGKAKKYGALCKAQGASKKHVKGEKGTPFRDCVKALSQLAKHPSEGASKACSSANESKKHVAGSPGSPFSECVKAAAKLRRSEKSHHSSTTSGS